MCSQPCAKSAVVSQDENATVVVILLGGEGWCVHGDVWNSVREELVSVSLAGSSCPEALRSCSRSGYLLLSESK